MMRSFEFRLDFFFRVFMDLIYYGVNLAFFKLLLFNTSSFAGWNDAQMMVFVATFCVVDGVQMTLTANNLWWLPTFVNRGDLDYYLVRPVSSMFFLSFRDVAVNSFLNLVCALGILAWALSRLPGPISLGSLTLFLLLILNGAVIHYLFRLILILPVFWTQGGRGFEQVFWGMTRVMERPDRIFKGPIWWIFSVALPYTLMASVPARIFFEGFRSHLLVVLVLVTAAFWALAISLWNFSLRNYSSASS
jgi:ABC-2 type transport system permease protein